MLQTITLHSHVGSDGLLNLQIPVEWKNRDFQVVVVMQLLEQPINTPTTLAEANGWPPGFFESTFGSLPDFPEIDAEGNYENREELS